jgi:hypothetical protein
MGSVARAWQAENSAEDAFLKTLSEGGEALKELLSCPTYEDWQGVLYNHEGEVVGSPLALDDWRTDELLPLRCPHPPTASKMATLIRQVKAAQDSIGGTVACVCRKVPAGLGEPVFDRLEAKLAHAMLSLPATKVCCAAAAAPPPPVRVISPFQPCHGISHTQSRRASSSALASAAPACAARSTTIHSPRRTANLRFPIAMALRSDSVRATLMPIGRKLATRRARATVKPCHLVASHHVCMCLLQHPRDVSNLLLLLCA